MHYLICSLLNSMDLKPTTVLRPYQVHKNNFTHARIESRKNWTPAQNERLDGVEGGNKGVDILRWLASLASPPPPPRVFALAFPIACVEK